MSESKTIKWTANAGNAIEITMVAEFGLDLQGCRKTEGEKTISIDTTIDGESLGGMASLKLIDHPQCVAKISNGRNGVGLSQDYLDQYNAALAELEASIAANNASVAEHIAKLDAVTDHRKALERSMSHGEI